MTSYNVLADSYATERLYPSTPPDILRWVYRGAAIVSRIAELRAEVACLQEVEAVHWDALRAALVPLGWEGVFAKKGAARVDGCALLFRTSVASLLQSEALYFKDGDEPSGHLMLVGLFDTALGLVSIATTHLRWQASTTERDAHIGYRQANELVAHLEARQKTSASIICGDFNVSSQHPVVQLFLDKGFHDAYAASPQYTCAPNHRAARIDFIFVSDALSAAGEPVPSVSDATLMPNRHEPSDHLPITARIALAGIRRPANGRQVFRR